jgi:hypothetical protein
MMLTSYSPGVLAFILPDDTLPIPISFGQLEPFSQVTLITNQIKLEFINIDNATHLQLKNSRDLL